MFSFVAHATYGTSVYADTSTQAQQIVLLVLLILTALWAAAAALKAAEEVYGVRIRFPKLRRLRSGERRRRNTAEV